MCETCPKDKGMEDNMREQDRDFKNSNWYLNEEDLKAKLAVERIAVTDEKLATPKKRCVHTGRKTVGYIPICDYGLIGNMRTAALVSVDGSVDHLCWPTFQDPTIFGRLLDKNKGGHFQIVPQYECLPKQNYLPSNNVLQTKWLSETEVIEITDYFPLPESTCPSDVFHNWLVRTVKCVRGRSTLLLECFPGFDYVRASHSASIDDHGNGYPIVRFNCPDMNLDIELLSIPSIDNEDCAESPKVEYRILIQRKLPRLTCVELEDRSALGLLGPGVKATIELNELQSLSFILRERPKPQSAESKIIMDRSFMSAIARDTIAFWVEWISQSTYHGRWREFVERSALALKLMTYEPTGALVASPTFSLPEDIGGPRNWDYRYTWIRDAAFTVYAFMRLGFTHETEAFMNFIEQKLETCHEDGSIDIMYRIEGDEELTEIELSHLDGYRGSRPVRIGNGAANHLQLDIYGELLDAIYLYNKYGKPISWKMWTHVRKLCDYVCDNWKRPDMSIWEVRNAKQNFTYSKIMLWVALDRGLRLADKRCLPCPNRCRWLQSRDEIYELVMERSWRCNLDCFVQSFESDDILDSSVLIMPLVFFISPSDPRFLSTMKKIRRSPERGGLMSDGLVYRYDHQVAADGVGGREGSFSMCTFWLIEAMARAGQYDKALTRDAVIIFQDMLGFANHLGLFSEEIALSGESGGNFPQAFTHLSGISAAYNLDRRRDYSNL